jgi:nucleotide-binding universal stress UspA family protein
MIPLPNENPFEKGKRSLRMLPLKRILCPTDFSVPSFKAVSAAGELAAALRSEVIVLNVIPPIPALTGPESPGVFDVSRYQAELEKSAEKALSEARKKKIPAKVKVRTIVSQGAVSKEIARVAKAERADLIVISTHGESGLQHLFGSVADRVMRHTTIPVLVIPARPGRK